MGDGHREAFLQPSGRVTRREALKALGMTGLGMALLSACGPQVTAPAPPAESKPAAAPAAKPADAAKAAAITPKDGGTFRIYLHTENVPSLDPYVNTGFR